MLFRKTLKAVSTVALGMVALVGANSAIATIDLDMPQTATSNAPMTFSAESLTIATGGVHSLAAGTTTALGISGTLGTLAALTNRDEALYIRVEVGGVLRLTGTAGPAMTGDAAGDNLSSRPTDPYLLYSLTASPTRAGTASYGVDLNGFVGATGLGAGTVMVRMYDSPGAAAAGGTGALVTKSATLVNVAPSVKIVVKKAAHTAMVDTGFLQLAPSVTSSSALANDTGSKYSLGGFDIQVNAMHIDAGDGTLLGDDPDALMIPEDGTADVAGTDGVPEFGEANIAVAPANPASSSSFAGDGGFAFTSAVELNSAADCSGFRPGAPDTTTQVRGAGVSYAKNADGTNNKAGALTGGIKERSWYLCVTVLKSNAVPIPAGSYTMDINLVAAVARPYPPEGISGAEIATIRHDGTTVQIPYLTSYEGYTQRIVIVNRNKEDRAFKLTFHTEMGGTATPETYDGMAAGGATTVVKVDEIVTLMTAQGASRGSATFTMVSNPNMVSVATTQVNKMDQSTDTVNLH